ncbi:hypothetical protein [Candidatus Phyllobacterium onerii]|uniref:hypothetical protein n=1 Tax=Candidatus Phyllobacterium onerii TaxID=3020828 RepID=UPI00232D34A8|nr:hypothetical protein [Phyllobacterium sp. IY22]
MLQISLGNDVITTSFTDFDDQLSNLVRFINEIDAGGFPSAQITEYGVATWSIEQGDDPEICRFTIDTRSMSSFSFQLSRLSTLIDRFFASFENSVMESFLQQSEDDWDSGVAEGRFEDDLDKQDDIWHGVWWLNYRLTQRCKRSTSNRKMMRTGVVPETMLAMI